MGQRVAREHRTLDALFAETRSAFASGDFAVITPAFERLRSAIQTHFDQEDRLYYPVIWGLRPERKTVLLEFVQAHEGFRIRLEAIAEQIASQALAPARQAFEGFAEAFAIHEEAEESALRSLEQEIRPSA